MPLDLVAEVRCFFGARLRQLEREFQDAVDADPRHHRLLRDEFARGIREHAAADRGIFALGVLAHHPEIDVAGLAVGQRRRHPRHQPHRAQVDILVELAAKLDQRPPQRNVIGNFRGPADRAEIDRVMLADLLFPVVRHHLAVLFVIVPRREIEMIEMHADAVFFRRGFQHAQAFRHHFLADAVAGNDRDPVLFFWVGHRESPLSCRTGKTMR